MSKGTISELFDDNGKRVGWQYRWRNPQGVQRKRNFERKSLAEAFQLTTEVSIRDHTYVDPKKGKQTFRDFADAWHERLTASHNYRVASKGTLKLHVYPVLGAKQMLAIKDDDITVLIQSMLESGLKASTIRTHMTLVRGIFKAAALKRVISGNPCIGVRLPKGAPAKMWLLEAVQVAALIANIDARYRALIALGAATGGRQGELFGLRMADVNWANTESPTVHFQQQLQMERGRGIVSRPLKNYEDRIIPVPLEMIDMLARHVREFPPAPGGYLFTRPQNGLMNARVFQAWPWERARRAAAEEFAVAANALAGTEAIQNTVRSQQLASVTMHQLRDYYASTLIYKGRPISEVSELLGHANQSTTLKYYSHLVADRDGKTRAIVGENLRQILPSVP